MKVLEIAKVNPGGNLLAGHLDTHCSLVASTLVGRDLLANRFAERLPGTQDSPRSEYNSMPEVEGFA